MGCFKPSAGNVLLIAILINGLEQSAAPTGMGVRGWLLVQARATSAAGR